MNQNNVKYDYDINVTWTFTYRFIRFRCFLILNLMLNVLDKKHLSQN